MTGHDPHHGSKPEQPPRALRVSAGLWCALAAFLLVQAVLAWFGRADLQRQLVDAGVVGSAPEAAEQARSLLLTNTGIAVVLAVVYAALGLLMLRRVAYVRGVVTAVALLQLVLALGSGAMSLVNAIVFALAGAAVVAAWRRTSNDWLTGER